MTIVTKLRENRPLYSGKRRALFYDKSDVNDIYVTLRELPDSTLNYFSYILRKKWAADFINGATTLVPGHIKVKINNITDNWSPTTYLPPNSFSDPEDSIYTNLAYSGYSQQQGGIVNFERQYKFTSTHGNDQSPPPGSDVPSPSPDIRFLSNSKGYTFFRQDYNIPAVRTTSDFSDHGYLTTFEIDRVSGTEEYLVAEEFTTGMTDGVDKFKLEKTTIVNDTGQGDAHKLLLDARSKQINLKQIGTGVGFGASDLGRPTADGVAYSGGNDAETDMVDYLFFDIEKRLREQEVGAVRVGAFQSQMLNFELEGLHFHGITYSSTDYDWHDLGIVTEDTRLQTDGSNGLLVEQYNMYINEDYATEAHIPEDMKIPKYKNSTIKLLRPYFGTDQTDGRRLVEMELTETSNFIANFLYQIFLRRYPVYDFFTTNYGYGNSNGLTYAGYIRDTSYSDSSVTIYGGGNTGPYTRTTTANLGGTIQQNEKYLHFCGLRGQSGITVRYPNL